MGRLRSRTARVWTALGLAVVASIAVVGIIAVVKDSTDEATPEPGTTSQPRRSGPCADLSPAAIDDALGGPTTFEIESPLDCTATREGTHLIVEIQQTVADADPDDLASVERRSGPDPDNLEPWPTTDVDDFSQPAVWLTDPDSDGTIGELHVLTARRLVRIAVSTPPDYRRDPLAIATSVAQIVAADLCHP